MRLWVDNVPGGEPPGTISLVNGGDLFMQAGLLPGADSAEPQSPTNLPAGIEGAYRLSFSSQRTGATQIYAEVNKALDFDRAASFGMRLDIPSGTAVRFEPGQALEVNLVEVGGRRRVSGFNSLTEGSIDSDDIKQAALTRAREQGFRGA